MSALDKIKSSIMTAIDLTESLVPRTTPKRDRLASCLLVAHRGTHDRMRGPVRENTIAAFDRSLAHGAWGIEFDIRWTLDDVPVVHHDRDTSRLFGKSLQLARTPFEQLRREAPEIPTFDEMIERYKGRVHLMIEIKRTDQPLGAKRIAKLENSLRELKAQRDYHLIGLFPELLLACEFVPRQALVLVPEVNVGELSKIAMKEGLGGLAGHYLLMTDAVLKRHREAGQMLGTGFPASRSVLFRELNREVDWIFTNHLPEMKSIIEAELARSVRN